MRYNKETKQFEPVDSLIKFFAKSFRGWDDCGDGALQYNSVVLLDDVFPDLPKREVNLVVINQPYSTVDVYYFDNGNEVCKQFRVLKIVMEALPIPNIRSSVSGN